MSVRRAVNSGVDVLSVLSDVAASLVGHLSKCTDVLATVALPRRCAINQDNNSLPAYYI